ncbi:MAG: hypothetical protein CM1200mP34_2550 [Verrucomicrobiales bacterium]|nr:MAG: hypothetical protein CM1200mP34_2550 [Verrucomicrobiales bacterium]
MTTLYAIKGFLVLGLLDAAQAEVQGPFGKLKVNFSWSMPNRCSIVA